MSEPTKETTHPVTPPTAAKEVKPPGNDEPKLQQLIDLFKLKVKKITAYQLGSVEVGDATKGESVSQKRFIGKPGHNPYLYIAQNITPVELAIEDGTVTAEQLKAVLALPDEVVPDGKSIKPVNIMLRDQLRKLSVKTREE
jgi:hypothetical protein